MASIKFTALALSACALIAACGGGGADAPPVEPKASCTARVVRIQLFGDSTQWGQAPVPGTNRATTYPEILLQGMMNAHFGAGAVAVSTRAINGTTSGQLLAGTDNVNQPWPQSVSADIVLMNHGVNDMFQGVPLDTYKANLRALAQAPARVVFETPLPVAFAGYQDFVQGMRDVAAELNVPVIETGAYAAAATDWNGDYATDGIHPNDAGYQYLVSGAVYPALEPMVAKLRCQ